MSNPFTIDISTEDQIANVQAALDEALVELARYGKTEDDAARLIAAHISRKWALSRPWYGAAWNVISARTQLAELREAH